VQTLGVSCTSRFLDCLKNGLFIRQELTRNCAHFHHCAKEMRIIARSVFRVPSPSGHSVPPPPLRIALPSPREPQCGVSVPASCRSCLALLAACGASASPGNWKGGKAAVGGGGCFAAAPSQARVAAPGLLKSTGQETDTLIQIPAGQRYSWLLVRKPAAPTFVRALLQLNVTRY
jgi:hypothetical protein